MMANPSLFGASYYILPLLKMFFDFQSCTFPVVVLYLYCLAGELQLVAFHICLGRLKLLMRSRRSAAKELPFQQPLYIEVPKVGVVVVVIRSKLYTPAISDRPLALLIPKRAGTGSTGSTMNFSSSVRWSCNKNWKVHLCIFSITFARHMNMVSSDNHVSLNDLADHRNSPQKLSVHLLFR